MAKITCPYCIREYDKKEILYVCPDCMGESKPGRFEKEPVKCKHGCGGYATMRVCPGCGQEIPKMALETPNLPFSIIGVSNAGKTNFITVMLNELGRSSGLRLALGSQTSQTRDHQNRNYSMIYEHHTPPGNTVPGVDDFAQIWYIKNLHKKSGSSVPTYTFTIFDGAGETHENMEPSSNIVRYIRASKAILIALDPLILPNIRRGNVVDPQVRLKSLSSDGANQDEAKNSTDVVNNVVNFIRSARGIKENKMLDIPVAVVLTKFDTIINHSSFSPSALVKKSSLTVSNGSVSMEEIRQVDEEIKNWLFDIGEGSFVDALDSNFKEYYFFGVSSYGSPPMDVGELNPEISPHRVLDPILWLFKRFKFID